VLLLGCGRAGAGGFFGRRRGDGEHGAEDVVVQGQARAQWRNGGLRGLENKIDVIPGGELLVGHPAEIPFVHFLHGLDFAPGAGDVRRHFVNDVLNAFLFHRVFEDEQTFVSFHVMLICYR